MRGGKGVEGTKRPCHSQNGVHHALCWSQVWKEIKEWASMCGVSDPEATGD
jgi:hypothetical protein